MKVKLNSQKNGQVVAIGLQGPQGPPGFSQIDIAGGDDLINLKDGSVLVYSIDMNKWEATTSLHKQELDCGQF